MRNLEPNERRFRLSIWLGLLVLVVIVFATVRMFSRVNHAARGTSSRTFEISVEFDKFRQIMVRKNATAAIVEHGGMELIEQHTQAVAVDLSGDDRPVLNALLGQSRADLAATKHITVRINDPHVGADRVSLTQTANIDAGNLNVITVANQPTGNLQDYETKLSARAEGASTTVTLDMDLSVRVDVARLFVSRADAQVQAAADEALRQQEAAIKHLIERYAAVRFVLPDLGDEPR